MGHKACPYCGANLDPGEKCDCQDEAAMSQQGNSTDRKDPDKNNHINYNEKEEIYHE